jgi:predicted HTH domain antitoxin
MVSRLSSNVILIKVDHLTCRAKITLTISEERKRHVIDLYHNQGKTTHEIAKIERMSIRDTSAILKEEESHIHHNHRN